MLGSSENAVAVIEKKDTKIIFIQSWMKKMKNESISEMLSNVLKIVGMRRMGRYY